MVPGTANPAYTDPAALEMRSTVKDILVLVWGKSDNFSQSYGQNYFIIQDY